MDTKQIKCDLGDFHQEAIESTEAQFMPIYKAWLTKKIANNFPHEVVSYSVWFKTILTESIEQLYRDHLLAKMQQGNLHKVLSLEDWIKAPDLSITLKQ